MKERKITQIDYLDIARKNIDRDIAIELAIQLLQVLRVQVSIEEGTFAIGTKMTMSSVLPVDRDRIRNYATTIIEDELNKELIAHSLRELIIGQFNSVAQWIDIAKNAKHRYTVKDILQIENIEQRMCALRIFGADKLIDEAGATLLSTSKKGHQLYVIKKENKLFIEDAYFLKYSCPSTGRIYVSGVPPTLFDRRATVSSRVFAFNAMSEDNAISPDSFTSINFRTMNEELLEPKYQKEYHISQWADLAMAWKFRLSLEEYLLLFKQNEA